MSPAASFAVVSVLFLTAAGLERVPALQFRPSPWRRPFLGADAAWYLVATTANLISVFVFQPWLSRLAVPGLADRVENLPSLAQVGLALVVYDFVSFTVHRQIHRSDTLWAVHKVHHSSLNLDWLATTRTHMFEHLLRNLPAQAALFALGMPSGTVAVTLAAYAAFALVGHSNLRIGNDRLETVFVTPRLHRLHHIPTTTQRNFGTVFTLWDRALGVLATRPAGSDERTGVPDEIDAYPQRFVAAFRRPLREAAARRSSSQSPTARGAAPARPQRPADPNAQTHLITQRWPSGGSGAHRAGLPRATPPTRPHQGSSPRT